MFLLIFLTGLSPLTPPQSLIASFSKMFTYLDTPYT